MYCLLAGHPRQTSCLDDQYVIIQAGLFVSVCGTREARASCVLYTHALLRCFTPHPPLHVKRPPIFVFCIPTGSVGDLITRRSFPRKQLRVFSLLTGHPCTAEVSRDRCGACTQSIKMLTYPPFPVTQKVPRFIFLREVSSKLDK